MEAFELDELLEAVGDEIVAVFVYIADVAGVQPAVFVYGVGCGLLVAQIAEHHLRPSHPDLAFFAHSHILASGGADDSAFGVGHQLADGAGFVKVFRAEMAHWAELGHAVSLHHPNPQPL